MRILSPKVPAGDRDIFWFLPFPKEVQVHAWAQLKMLVNLIGGFVDWMTSPGSLKGAAVRAIVVIAFFGTMFWTACTVIGMVSGGQPAVTTNISSPIEKLAEEDSPVVGEFLQPEVLPGEEAPAEPEPTAEPEVEYSVPVVSSISIDKKSVAEIDEGWQELHRGRRCYQNAEAGGVAGRAGSICQANTETGSVFLWYLTKSGYQKLTVTNGKWPVVVILFRNRKWVLELECEDSLVIAADNGDTWYLRRTIEGDWLYKSPPLPW